jgi:hypothetical protein
VYLLHSELWIGSIRLHSTSWLLSKKAILICDLPSLLTIFGVGEDLALMKIPAILDYCDEIAAKKGNEFMNIFEIVLQILKSLTFELLMLLNETSPPTWPANFASPVAS